jgi:hypothetical protein
MRIINCYYLLLFPTALLMMSCNGEETLKEENSDAQRDSDTGRLETEPEPDETSTDTD